MNVYRLRVTTRVTVRQFQLAYLQLYTHLGIVRRYSYILIQQNNEYIIQ